VKVFKEVNRLKKMRKRVYGILVLFSIILVSSFVISQTEEDINKAMQCLDDRVAAASSLSLQEAVFAALADVPHNKVAATINNQKSNSAECWPKSGCKIKDTAQVIIAKNSLDEDVSGAIAWLKGKTGSATGLTWFLQITPDNNGAAECVVSYDSVSATITIDDELKLSGNGGSCLSITSSGYWLELKNNCLEKTFKISCLDQDFKTNLLYQKESEGTIFVSSVTNSAAAKGVTEEKITAQCFKDSGDCNYEASLWATTALYDSGEDTSELVPYLRALSGEGNGKYFPSAFLKFILPGSAGDAHYEKMMQLQEPLIYGGLWKIQGTPYNQYYDTALAMAALGGADAPEVKDYTMPQLFGLQTAQGCWNNNNVRDTAFIIYAAGWQRGGTETPGEECNSEDLDLCFDPETCTAAGGYWYDNICNVNPPASGECDFSSLETCGGAVECTNAGGYWYNNQCNENPEFPELGERDIKFSVKDSLSGNGVEGAMVKIRKGSSSGTLVYEELTDSQGFTLELEVEIGDQYYFVVSKEGYPAKTLGEKIPDFNTKSQDPLIYGFILDAGPPGAVCDSNNLNLCLEEDDCKASGGYWYDDICNKDPAECDVSHVPLCEDEETCTGFSGYWYNDECHVDPEPPYTPPPNSCYVGDWYDGDGKVVNTLQEEGYCHLPDVDDWPAGCCPAGYECEYESGNESQSICVKKGGGSGGPYNPSGSTICETAGYYCVADAYTCIADADGDPLHGFDCNSYAEVCCTNPAPEENCVDKSGRVCAFDEVCSGSVVQASDGACCLDLCNPITGLGDDDDDSGSTGGGGEATTEEEGGSLWGWIVFFLILIVLTILGIVYKDKIRLWWFKMRGKAKTSKVGPSGPGISPITMRRAPPSFGGLHRPRPHPSIAVRRPPSLAHHRPPVSTQNKPSAKPVAKGSKKKSSKEKEMDETLKKLKEMAE
jgi:hypothetical protein